MKSFVAFFVLAVAAASAKPSGWGGIVAPVAINPAAHIPSGSISVGPNGATVAGPAGSVVSDNGLHTGRAGARLAGPSGTVSGWGAGGIIEGPSGVSAQGIALAAPVARVAVAAPIGVGIGLNGLGVNGLGLGLGVNGLGVNGLGLGLGVNGLGVNGLGLGVNGLGLGVNTLGLGVGRVGLVGGHGW